MVVCCLLGWPDYPRRPPLRPNGGGSETAPQLPRGPMPHIFNSRPRRPFTFGVGTAVSLSKASGKGWGLRPPHFPYVFGKAPAASTPEHRRFPGPTLKNKSMGHLGCQWVVGLILGAFSDRLFWTFVHHLPPSHRPRANRTYRTQLFLGT